MESYEKKYKDALERAKEYKNHGYMMINAALDNIFPELKENRDERIRKTLIAFHKSTIDINGVKGSDIIEWLEKQDRREPTWSEEDEHRTKDIIYFLDTAKKHYASTVELEACIAWIKSLRKRVQVTKGKSALKETKEEKIDNENKVESKFKIGYWVVFNNNHESIYQIEKIENFQYALRHVLGGSMPLSFSHEDMIRLWTIKDAKPGDVLATSAGAFIYNGNNGGGSCPGSYCGIDTLGNFKTGTEHHWTTKPAFPATKEQRELLFQKMKEAGYEWNEKNKELKKIETDAQLTEFEEAIKDLMDAYRDAIGDEYATIEEVKKHAAYLLSLIH